MHLKLLNIALDVRPVKVTSSGSSQEPEQLKQYKCRNCGSKITDQQHESKFDGRFAYTFFNPSGIVYNIGIFYDAECISAIGKKSNEFSWFRGHSWQVLCCCHCDLHLGWRYQGEDVFYGFILDRLMH